MPATAPELDNVFFEDQQPAPGDHRAELLAGLQLEQKQVNPRYFYDAHGSALFEKITQLPEYYLTRTEVSILSRHTNEIARCCGRDCVVIEPGSGNSEKVRLLLDAMQPAAYVPMDISARFLYEAALKLGQEYPWMSVHAVCADFSGQWHTHATLPPGRRVVFYPGSTMGNMHPEDAREFLSGLRRWTGADGGVLIGVDLHKSERLLHAAYNDAAGVTAEFNLNILTAINSALQTDLRQEDFSHRAFYNQDLRRIEMHLVCERAHTVKIDNIAIEFRKGETLHTENSYKYSLESFNALSSAAGLELRQSWLDEQDLFSVHYLTVAAP